MLSLRKILASLSAPRDSTHKQASKSERLNAAVSLHKQGNLDQAEPIYLALLAEEPQHADLLQYLGLLNAQRGKAAVAFQYWQDALALSPTHFAALNNYGKALIDQQQFVRALTQFDMALTERPDSAHAWHDRGNALFGLHRYADAGDSYRRALGIDPDFAEAHSNLGNTLKNLRQHAEAVSSYRRALEIRPDFADAYSNLADTLNELGEFEEAAACCRKALKIKPDFSAALNNFANALKQLGQFDEAIDAYRQALLYEPDFADANINLGILLKDMKRPSDAEAALRRALDLRPDQTEILGNLGLVLMESKRLEEAEAIYRRVLQIQPDSATTLCNLGILLTTARRHEEAEACYRQALDTQPDSTLTAQVYSNLGNLLGDTNRIPEAMACYRQALAIKPEFAEAHGNMGTLLAEEEQLEEAKEYYRQALEIDPDFTGVSWNLSLLLLAQGRYAEAWPYHESRYAPSKKTSMTTIPPLPCPQWQGEPLDGKSILIWPEQGYGDYIQFSRYAPLLKARGASRVTLVCTAALQTLLETVDGVDAAISDLESIPIHDYWVFPLSLPLHFHTTLDNLPATLPYLRVSPAANLRWHDRLHFPAETFKVGLVWQGNPGHKNDLQRSLPGLDVFAPLWDIEGVSFCSLQKPISEKDLELSVSTQPCAVLGADIAEFADSAAIVAQLNLVICVDTAIAHLAGGMGKPCWVLLPFRADWRWLMNRSDSPWYPEVMRLFRQAERGNWESAVMEVATALRHQVQEHRRQKNLP